MLGTKYHYVKNNIQAQQLLIKTKQNQLPAEEDKQCNTTYMWFTLRIHNEIYKKLKNLYPYIILTEENEKRIKYYLGLSIIRDINYLK